MTATVHSHPALGSTAIGITLAGGVLVMLLRDVGPLDPLAVFVGGLAVFLANREFTAASIGVWPPQARICCFCFSGFLRSTAAPNSTVRVARARSGSY